MPPDEPTTTPTPTPPAPPTNTEAARNPDGSLKDQSTTTSAAAPPTPPSEPTSSKPDATSSSPDTDKDKSLLNQGDKKEEPKAGKPEGAPEKYEAYTAPEGYEFNAESVTKANDLFKSLGLSQEQAQSVMNLAASEIAKAEEAPMDLWKQTQEKWVAEIKADPDLGPNLDRVKTTISRALDATLGDPKLVADFKAAMDFTGAGNNPAFVRGFYRMAQKLSEGTSVSGRGPSPHGQAEPGAKPPTAAAALYPNLK